MTLFRQWVFFKIHYENFQNTLVLATEIAKVYCDELEQIMYPEVINAVEVYLKRTKKSRGNLYKKYKA